MDGGFMGSEWRELPAADRKNRRRYVIWWLAWGVVFTTTSIVLKHWPQLVPGLPLRVALIALSTALGVATALAFIRFLRQTDELVRKTNLEAMAVAFGAIMVLGTTWGLVENAGGPHWNLRDAFLVIVYVWLIAQIFANSRYR